MTDRVVDQEEGLMPIYVELVIVEQGSSFAEKFSSLNNEDIKLD